LRAVQLLFRTTNTDPVNEVRSQQTSPRSPKSPRLRCEHTQHLSRLINSYCGLDERMDLTDHDWSTDTVACQLLTDTVNWRNVQAYASGLHEGEPCDVEAPVGVGGRHFVRILTFEGGERWLARFAQQSDDAHDSTMLREVDCLRMVAERSTIPVPKVFAVVSHSPEYGPAFMLMECLPGNVGTDVSFDVPEQHKTTFFRQMANAQVRKPDQHKLSHFKLTCFLAGTNVEHYFPAHRNPSQACRWNHRHRTNPWYRRPVRHCFRLLPCLGSSCYVPKVRSNGESSMWPLQR
jgi:hypothetical protein